MSQVPIYLDAETERKMQKILKKRGVSKSKWIAASALANNCTLVTHNKEEFPRVPGLKIEDWF